MSAQCEGRIQFLSETPDFHDSDVVQSYIDGELTRPSKTWVQDVVCNKRECESVKLRTEDFVLLPDTNANRRQYRQYPPPPFRGEGEPCTAVCGLPRWAGGKAPRWPLPAAAQQHHGKSFNWLAIVTDCSVRSVRDLRGHHAAMLEDLYERCLAAIKAEFGLERHDVMAFANYPPSVYRLHIHFCAPFFTSSAYDAFRMHSLSGIINNLRVCPDYYRLSTFYIPVHSGSEFHKVWERNQSSDEADD